MFIFYTSYWKRNKNMDFQIYFWVYYFSEFINLRLDPLSRILGNRNISMFKIMKILRREQDTIKTQREFRGKLESTEILKLLKWITYSAN